MLQFLNIEGITAKKEEDEDVEKMRAYIVTGDEKGKVEEYGI